MKALTLRLILFATLALGIGSTAQAQFGFDPMLQNAQLALQWEQGLNANMQMVWQSAFEMVAAYRQTTGDYQTPDMVILDAIHNQALLNNPQLLNDRFNAHQQNMSVRDGAFWDAFSSVQLDSDWQNFWSDFMFSWYIRQ